MHKLILLLFLSSAGWAQMVTFGVKGGAALGSPTSDYGHLKVDPGHWTVGPAVEFHCRIRLSLEIAAMYSTYTVEYPTIQPVPVPPFHSIGETRAWDFPAVVKYRFTEGTVRPFVFAGVNYRRENTDVRGFCGTEANSGCAPTSYSTSQDRLGPTAGAGIEWKPGRIRFAPEFRYTHLNRPGADQVSILLGISF